MTYRYQGRQGWPDDPATRDDKGIIQAPKGGAKIRKAGREARTDEYCRLRDLGVSKDEAGVLVGVQEKTARRYEAAWQARKAATP